MSDFFAIEKQTQEKQKTNRWKVLDFAIKRETVDLVGAMVSTALSWFRPLRL